MIYNLKTIKHAVDQVLMACCVLMIRR